MLLYTLFLELGFSSGPIRSVVDFVYACLQGHDLLALEVLLLDFAFLMSLDEVMEVNGPEGQHKEHTLMVKFAIPVDDSG